MSVHDQYAIPLGLLEVEFAESITFNSAVRLLQTVARLKKAGFSCSINGFGGDYSSLGLLKNLPIDILKIDSLFLDEGPDQNKDMALVEGIIDIAKKFDIRTVVEGIESVDQAKYLKQTDCDYVQDYVSYRPVLRSDYETLIIQRR